MGNRTIIQNRDLGITIDREKQSLGDNLHIEFDAGADEYKKRRIQTQLAWRFGGGIMHSNIFGGRLYLFVKSENTDDVVAAIQNPNL